MESCPICHRQYGKRKRCYYCDGRPRTGVTKECQYCGKPFYLQLNGVKDPRRKGGVYCSNQCRIASMRGKPSWRRMSLGSTRTRQDGYIEVKVAETGSYARDWQLKHRLVMENYLDRQLESQEHVHHINRNKLDNRINNLRLMSNSEHGKLSAALNHLAKATA